MAHTKWHDGVLWTYTEQHVSVPEYRNRITRRMWGAYRKDQYACEVPYVSVYAWAWNENSNGWFKTDLPPGCEVHTREITIITIEDIQISDTAPYVTFVGSGEYDDTEYRIWLTAELKYHDTLVSVLDGGSLIFDLSTRIITTHIYFHEISRIPEL